MTTLFDYQKQIQRLAREARQEFLNPEDIVSYVNIARREVAMRAQCIRRLTPTAGSIVGWTVTNAGSGYSNNPTLTITPPDYPAGTLPSPNGAQATASCIVENGTIAAVFSQYGGAGYFQPAMTITDTTGTGATAVTTVPLINTLKQGQEVYPFSGIDVTMLPGIDSVYMIRSVSIVYANYRYSLPMYDFSTYQAYVRQYPFQYQYVPTFASQYGQGVDGSFYAYPLPSQTYQWEFDCFCLPQDLIDNQSFEAIPMPWTDAVPYFALHLAYLSLQNFNVAQYFDQQFDKRLLRYSQYARPGRWTNPYGRY